MRPDRREPLWTRIERNGPKLVLYLGAFVIALAAAAEVVIVLPVAVAVWWSYLTSDVPDAPFAPIMIWGGVLFVALGVVGALVASRRSERSILAQLQAVRVPVGELPETKSALHDMSLAVGMRYPPPLYVLDSCALNAFVVGRTPERAAVGVTTGLLKVLTPDEQRAVFANLLTRLADGDVLIATIVSSLMSPAWMWRRHDLQRDDDPETAAAMLAGQRPMGTTQDANQGLGVVFVLFFWTLAIFVTEFLYYGHMQQQILTAEAADSKGMLLLKEPRAMLSALQKVLPGDNSIALAGAGMAPLFFAWTGDAYVDERDPEVRRVGRMREVLGPEGFSAEGRGIDPATADAIEPPAPRIVG